MYQDKAQNITAIIYTYFEGIYTGNVAQLRESFHPAAVLYGDVAGASYLKSLDDYLHGVENRQSPEDMGESNKMEVVSLEIIGHAAVAKVHVPILGYNYYDFLSLAIVDGQWKIVNKVFSHVE